MESNAKIYPNYFSVNVSVLAIVFGRQISKNRQFQGKLSFFEICRRITTASTETFIEK